MLRRGPGEALEAVGFSEEAAPTGVPAAPRAPPGAGGTGETGCCRVRGSQQAHHLQVKRTTVRQNDPEVGAERQVQLLDHGLAPADDLSVTTTALKVLRGQVVAAAETEHPPNALVDATAVNGGRQPVPPRGRCTPGAFSAAPSPTSSSASTAGEAPRSTGPAVAAGWSAMQAAAGDTTPGGPHLSWVGRCDHLAGTLLVRSSGGPTTAGWNASQVAEEDPANKKGF